jgi:hypothetical protein
MDWYRRQVWSGEKCAPVLQIGDHGLPVGLGNTSHIPDPVDFRSGGGIAVSSPAMNDSCVCRRSKSRSTGYSVQTGKVRGVEQIRRVGLHE